MMRGAAVSTKEPDAGSRNGCVAIDTAFYTEGAFGRIFKLSIGERQEEPASDWGGLFKRKVMMQTLLLFRGDGSCLIGVFLLESLHAAGRIDEFLLAGEKRMAI